MNKRFTEVLRRACLVALLTVALVATAFGHRIPATSDVAIDAYVLAGGSLADLCGDVGGAGKLSHRDCPACHIVGATLLPPAAVTIIDANYAFVARVVTPRESRAIRVVRDDARGLRAPPVV